MALEVTMQQWINDNGNVTVDDDDAMIDDSDDRQYQCEANDVMVDHNDVTMPPQHSLIPRPMCIKCRKGPSDT